MILQRLKKQQLRFGASPRETQPMPLVRGRLLLEKLLPHFESLPLCRKRHRGAVSHLRFPPPNSPSPRSSCVRAPFPPARVPGREPERVGSEPAPGVRGAAVPALLASTPSLYALGKGPPLLTHLMSRARHGFVFASEGLNDPFGLCTLICILLLDVLSGKTKYSDDSLLTCAGGWRRNDPQKQR